MVLLAHIICNLFVSIRKRAVHSLWTTLAEAYAFISADWDKCEHSEYHPGSDIPLLFSGPVSKADFFRWCQYGIAVQNLLRDWDDLLRHLILATTISFLLQQSGFRALQILDFGR